MDKDSPIINIEGISFAYPGGPTIIDNLDLKFFRGDRVGLVGHNGSGKTTLFHIIMGLLKPSSGKIEVFGKPVSEEKDFLSVRQRIGLLFQDADDQLFSPTVIEDVAFGPLNLGKSKEEAIEVSRKTLEFLGLHGFEERITFKLSGGEKRLVSLATVLAMKPEVLLLDEPTNSLDEKTIDILAKVLLSMDISYILISHDPDFLFKTTNKIYTMDKGKILSGNDIDIHYHAHTHKLGKLPHYHK